MRLCIVCHVMVYLSKMTRMKCVILCTHTMYANREGNIALLYNKKKHIFDGGNVETDYLFYFVLYLVIYPNIF